MTNSPGFRNPNQKPMPTMKIKFITTIASLLLTAQMVFGADLPVAVEKDPRVQANGQRWRLDKAVPTNPTLPRVLLIGDSVLNGYQHTVAKLLIGKAYVDAWVNPYCQGESYNTLLVDVLKQNGPYDVVHFNMGLHGFQKDRMVKGSTEKLPRIPDGQFEPLTKAFVEVIKKENPKAKIIWASTTPISLKENPMELDSRNNPIIIEHNRMAAKVMGEENVPVNDLYTLMASHPELKQDGFHWKDAGKKMQGEAIAAAVLKVLPEKRQTASLAQVPSKGSPQEPTNPEEAKAKALAAEKKAAREAAVAEKYKALVATLPPEQQAWERVLQANLGGFYLPWHESEKIAHKSNAWDFVQDDPKLPRVLLIGDSVSRGYTLAARRYLAGKANVHRAPENCGNVAKGLTKLDIWLGDGKWDVIHFNFGIHDKGTPLDQYKQRLEQFIAGIQKTGAKLVWASTTPIPDNPAKKETAASIVEHNQAAAEVMKTHQIPVDDLFCAVTPHVSEYQLPMDVHFKEAGYDFLGNQVGASISAVLDGSKK